MPPFRLLEDTIWLGQHYVVRPWVYMDHIVITDVRQLILVELVAVLVGSLGFELANALLKQNDSFLFTMRWIMVTFSTMALTIFLMPFIGRG